MFRSLPRVSTVLLGVTSFAVSTSARAQDFNIDVGEDPGFSNGVPSVTYGAAAGQPGVWNALADGLAGAGAPATGSWYVASNLLRLDGSPSTVSVKVEQMFLFPGVGDFAFDIPTTSGDDAKLLDDVASCGTDLGLTLWDFSNLEHGIYDVYVYAFAPDNASFVTEIDAHSDTSIQSGGCSGGWTGAYVVGQTHVVQTVPVQDGRLRIGIGTSFGRASVNGIQLVLRESDHALPYCFGDGTYVSCPCGNQGISGHGCASSVFTSGAQLIGTGTASVASDTFSLVASSMTGNAALFIQCTGVLALPIDDGIGCIAGNHIRIGVKATSGNSATNPSGVDQPISVKGLVPPGGGRRNYQVAYRNVASFCTAFTTNRTNAVAVVWKP